MPDRDGFEATSLIREQEASGGSHRLVIIAMTANVMQRDRGRCLAAGMDAYLSKPISVDALASVLDRVNQQHERSQRGKNHEAA